jgi:hypothetical protein
VFRIKQENNTEDNDTTLHLRRSVADLTDLLAMERQRKADLEVESAELTGELAAERQENVRLLEEIARLKREVECSGRGPGVDQRARVEPEEVG